MPLDHRSRTIALGHLEMHTFDLSPARKNSGMAVDGVLGMTFLRGSVTLLNFDLSRWVIFRGKDISAVSRDEGIPIHYLKGGLPAIDAELVGVGPFRFVTHTGSDSPVTLNRSEFDRAVQNRAIRVTNHITKHSLSQVYDALLGRVEALEVDEIRIPQLVVDQGRSEQVPILGLNLWERFNVTFDFVADRLRLSPSHRRFRRDHSDGDGISVQWAASQKYELTVYPASPAYQHGVRTGDVLLKIRSMSVDRVNLNWLRDAFQRWDDKDLELLLERNGQQLEIVVPRGTIQP